MGDTAFERSAALVKEWLRFHGYTGALQQMEKAPAIRSQDLVSWDSGPEAWRRHTVDRMVGMVASGDREGFWAQVSQIGCRASHTRRSKSHANVPPLPVKKTINLQHEVLVLGSLWSIDTMETERFSS